MSDRRGSKSKKEEAALIADYISTFEITDKNDAYIRIKQKSRKDKLITDEWINEWRKRNTTNE